MPSNSHNGMDVCNGKLSELHHTQLPVNQLAEKLGLSYPTTIKNNATSRKENRTLTLAYPTIEV